MKIQIIKEMLDKMISGFGCGAMSKYWEFKQMLEKLTGYVIREAQLILLLDKSFQLQSL